MICYMFVTRFRMAIWMTLQVRRFVTCLLRDSLRLCGMTIQVGRFVTGFVTRFRIMIWHDVPVKQFVTRLLRDSV